MRDGGLKLIIVEGEDREYKIFENSIKDFFFKPFKMKFITLPVGGNIYALWNQLKADDFETDILELIKEKWSDNRFGIDKIQRDEIDEIFLFFDYDAQQKNLPKDVDPNVVLKEMLDTFSDETEFGKLYISYPMIEAIRDWTDCGCKVITKCVLEKGDLKSYKNKTSISNPNLDVRKYSVETWRALFKNFIIRMSRLFDLSAIPEYSYYKNLMTPQAVFTNQQRYIKHDRIFVLSPIPEFVLDYYGETFWKSWIKIKKLDKRFCKKRDVDCI